MLIAQAGLAGPLNWGSRNSGQNRAIFWLILGSAIWSGSCLLKLSTFPGLLINSIFNLGNLALQADLIRIVQIVANIRPNFGSFWDLL